MGKQRRKQLLHDSKGASLVLVLVAMMFVGIIASIVLTITVGNSKSTRTTQDSSQNFYYTESALDDLKLYLNKFATSIATDALLDTLAGSGTVKEGDHTLTDDELFNKLFSEKLGTALASFVSDTDITETVGTDKVFQEEFLKQYITFGRTGDIKISFDPVLEYVETTDESTGFVYKYPKLHFD